MKINNEIDKKSVLVIDENGKKIGFIDSTLAVKMAQDKGVDLVEVNDGICKFMDYGKFKFQEGKKKKNRPKPDREIQLTSRISEHDLETKVNATNRLLRGGHRVKIVLRLEFREISHPENGMKIMKTVFDRVGNCIIDSKPTIVDRQIIMVLRSDKT